MIDLSSLWAGPLCGELLAHSGADVVKIESRARPDGARDGSRAFFDRLNASKRSVVLDFDDAADRRTLARLLERADIVIESARPRALRQLGVRAETIVERRPGLTWIRITGHGATPTEADRVAFGDDAAVAAGLGAAVADAHGPRFCADAVADPLAGLHAAVAALGSFRSGGGRLVDMNLVGVARCAMDLGPHAPECATRRTFRGRGRDTSDGWEARVEGEWRPVAPPRLSPARGRARALGADTAAVVRELDDGC